MANYERTTLEKSSPLFVAALDKANAATAELLEREIRREEIARARAKVKRRWEGLPLHQ